MVVHPTGSPIERETGCANGQSQTAHAKIKKPVFETLLSGAVDVGGVYAEIRGDFYDSLQCGSPYVAPLREVFLEIDVTCKIGYPGRDCDGDRGKGYDFINPSVDKIVGKMIKING